ncbi:MAG: hypothetical protein JO219_10700 [Candidatus Eremiobacteraeota bacterium]|nr:hypothetical protein [Candidatus Eremiobacteraeota bacterium]MBV8365551.1 hypothetical protein [Candidatus Eremiobacteraeota bacterium]
MPGTPSPFLNAWSSFYVMAGSSAASLTGLMFVVITLVMRIQRSRRSDDGIATFSTPTVMHFAAVLFISANLCAPWQRLIHPSIIVGVSGLFGVIYMCRIMYRTKQLREYVADVEDWVWYNLFPLLAYALIFAGAVGLMIVPGISMFALGGGAVSLLFIGIRNAWDVVTFIATADPETLAPASRESTQGARGTAPEQSGDNEVNEP